IPWVMMMDQTGQDFLHKIGPAGVHLATALAALPVLLPMLSGLRARWQHDSLLHGDMKWENCLIVGRPGEGGQGLMVVDCELVDIGDGAWDVATIIKEYLVTSLMNARPMDQLRPVIREFWTTYAGRRDLADERLREYCARVIAFTAARMVVAVL